jgi:hypothetical protein
MASRADLRVTDVSPDTPLRLDIAARLAFPDGSMTGRGLRREANRGRLAVERVAGKDYTTLEAIREMRTQCRVTPQDHGYGTGGLDVMRKAALPTKLPSLSSIEAANSALAALRTTSPRQRRRSGDTSKASM